MFFAGADDAERFAAAVPADTWSPAQVQERLLKAGSPAEAIALFDDAVTPLRRVA